MTTSPFYCSLLSRSVSEKRFGTASIGEVWVLLEYPKPWCRDAFDESEIPSHVRRFITRTLRTIPRSRLLLIKQDRKPKDRLSMFVVSSRERRPLISKFQFTNYEEVQTFDIAGASQGNLAENVADEPLFLVCTHGRRDKCCAKFGFALYKNLTSVAGRRVWQCSHVGGDRFAANLLCFPHGLFYGQVGVEAGTEIVGEYLEGRVALDNYRGRSCYAHSIQSAEYFIRSETGIRDLDSLIYYGRTKVSDNVWNVQFSQPATREIFDATVRSSPGQHENYLTCSSSETQRVNEWSLEDFGINRH
jgi:hypothetical protein